MNRMTAPFLLVEWGTMDDSREERSQKLGNGDSMKKLIGMRVYNRKTSRRGIISEIRDKKMYVLYDDEEICHLYPDAFVDILLLEDASMQQRMREASSSAQFDTFKNIYTSAIQSEIEFLKETGGKRYRMVDGERLQSDKNAYIYSFDTDSELHFTDGTIIKLLLPAAVIPAYVISCEEFTITLRAMASLGEQIESIEFTAEPWQLLESLVERVTQLEPSQNYIAYQVACLGHSHINKRKSLQLGQSAALKKAAGKGVTFIWGPPGTGKTTALARIVSEYILKGKRVLMLSYSNVSVDGALLKVAGSLEYEEGNIIRYGYPRLPELLDNRTLTSYGYVLHKNPELEREYKALQEEKKRLKRKDARRAELTKRMNEIRKKLSDEEKRLIQNAAFVATTVSKAVVDSAVYAQRFDAVVFDEASMAYIPQIVFAASLAKEHFCCLGDFKQLPAIVQSPENPHLSKDIFEYTGILEAVENGYGHDWLVMLNVQYRMHPTIASFVSHYMYEDLLVSAEAIYGHKQKIADCLPIKKEPMAMVDLSGTYSVCTKTMDGSRINLLSAMVCVRIAELLAGEYEIGIITPYSAQSRLILAMLRDLREQNEKYNRVSCATVHQFQGSEKPVIVYDAVDCFRMPYPGTLLTTLKNDTANRLFNVALTRTQGKFLLVANGGYMRRKNISKNLIFAKMMKNLTETSHLRLRGERIYDEIGTQEGIAADVFLGDRDDVDSWERYLADIRGAKRSIWIDVPGLMDEDEDALEDLSEALAGLAEQGVHVSVRTERDVTVPAGLQAYVTRYPYVAMPITMIDSNILWYGEPLSAADFISEGELIETQVFPCVRMRGKYISRLLKAFLDISNETEWAIEVKANA